MDRTTAKASGNGTATAARSVELPTRDRSPATVALDDLVRRRLRVSDPTDPHEIALALERAYPVEKVKLTREAEGMPFATGRVLPPPHLAPVAGLNEEAELAVDALERDIAALRDETLLADVKAEIRGWGSGILATIRDGIASARAGADARQRERAFAMRRTVGDYARLLRYIAALTPKGSHLYRQLALSLDQAASVALVALGSALSEAGVVGGRFLMQVQGADLRTRRDAVLAALRNLTGTGGAAAPDGWLRGVLALRQLTAFLQEAGHGDLEPLLDESYLARQLDALVHAAASEDADTSRALASSGEPTLNSLRRLVLICRGVANPDAPTLEAFRIALQHFLDPFEPTQAASGYRLPFVSRAPLLMGRFAGLGGPDIGTERLMDLCAQRFAVAQEVEHFLQFEFANDARVGLQVLLDAVLYDFDRAIDLYALGVDAGGDGAAEWRAATYGYVAYQVLAVLPADLRSAFAAGELADMCATLVYWQGAPFPAPPAPLGPAPGAAEQFAIGEELAMRRTAEERWYELVRSAAPRFVAWTRIPAPATMVPFLDAAGLMAGAPIVPPAFASTMPRDVPTLLEVVI